MARGLKCLSLSCFLLLSFIFISLLTPPFGFARPRQVPLSELRERTGLSIRKRATDLTTDLTRAEVLLLSKIATAADKRNWPAAWSHFAGYAGSGSPIYGAALNAAFRCRKYKEGAKIYDQCLENCEIIVPSVFSSALRIFGKLESPRVDEIWNEALKVCELDVILGSARIAAAADLGDVDSAAEALDKMSNSNVAIDVYHINSAMRACWGWGNKRHKAAKYFFDLLPQFQQSPTIVSFTSLIGAYYTAPLQDVLSAYHQMKAMEIKPDSVFAETYTFAVLQADRRAHVRGEKNLRQTSIERLEAAKAALEDFKKEGLQLTRMCEDVYKELSRMGI